MAISFRRALARERRRFATFAHAMSSTSVVNARKINAIAVAPPAISTSGRVRSSGKTCASRSLFVPGYAAARRCEIVFMAAPA